MHSSSTTTFNGVQLELHRVCRGVRTNLQPILQDIVSASHHSSHHHPTSAPRTTGPHRTTGPQTTQDHRPPQDHHRPTSQIVTPSPTELHPGAAGGDAVHLEHPLCSVRARPGALGEAQVVVGAEVDAPLDLARPTAEHSGGGGGGGGYVSEPRSDCRTQRRVRQLGAK